MKKFSLIALIAVVVLSLSAGAQKVNLKINLPKEGRAYIADTLPRKYFAPTMLMVVAQDLKNNIAPENVEVKIKGPNSFFDKFNITGGTQRNYKSFPQDSVEVTVTKAGYKTVTFKALVKLPGVIAVRLDAE